MKKTLFLCILLVFIGAQAHALLITPDPGLGLIASGNETSQSDIDAILLGLIGTDFFQYKADVPDFPGPYTPPDESGPLAGSYETVYFPEDDPMDADIHYTGGPTVGSPAHLLVKDGNQVPAWYLFELSPLLGWDGMEILELRDFWPNQGAISHVALYGGEVPIPEPTTILLLGIGLAGIAGFGRKKLFKK
jgi:hypothetical protein